MRPLIQYDLDEPPTAPSAPPPTVTRPPNARPTKKRKRHHHNAPRPQKAPLQHWDDPGSTPVGMMYDEQEGGAATLEVESLPGTMLGPGAAVSYGDDVEEEEEYYDYEYGYGEEDGGAEEEEEEESRALTHQEIWDDKALVDAWNSAEAEYEVCTISPPSPIRPRC